jgi:hypothetical protein
MQRFEVRACRMSGVVMRGVGAGATVDDTVPRQRGYFP